MISQLWGIVGLALVSDCDPVGFYLEFGEPLRQMAPPPPQRVPPIPRCLCPLASSFLYSLFQRGWRPAVVCLQLETELKEMGLDCSPRDFRGESDNKGGFGDSGWPSEDPSGGIMERDGSGELGLGGREGAGRLLYGSGEIQLPTPSGGLIIPPRNPLGFVLFYFIF